MLGICKAFAGRTVLENVDLTLKTGEVTALIGPSGSGKTTLARILLGLERPDAGCVEGARGLRAAAVFQEDRLIDHLDARANLELVLPGRDADRVVRLLADLGLNALDDKPVRLYSGGMARRVALARALIAAPQLLVLDEPFRGLDGALRARAADAVLAHSGGAATLLITHDAAEIDLLRASRQVFLK